MQNKKKKHMSSERRKQMRLLPGHIAVGIWVLFTLLMLFWIVAASLSTSPEIMSGQVLKFKSGLHFDNYARAWGANNISTYFLNSLFYGVVSMVLSVLISAPAAYVLARRVFKGRHIINSSLVAAMSVPQIMIVMPLFSAAVRSGLSSSKIVLLILYTGMSLPYTTTFLTAFFTNQSVVYEEAAAIDGSTPMNTFWKIMFPLAQPAIVTVGIFNFMNVWNEYFLSMIFASSQKNMTVGPGLKSVLTAMQYTGDWGGLFAAVVIVFMPTLLIFCLLSRTIINGITDGGIKG